MYFVVVKLELRKDIERGMNIVLIFRIKGTDQKDRTYHVLFYFYFKISNTNNLASYHLIFLVMSSKLFLYVRAIPI